MRIIALSDLHKRIMTVLATLAMAILLALPALVYLIKLATLTNLLSFIVSMGFFYCIIFHIRNFYVQSAIGLLILLLNTVEIVHIFTYGHPISLGGVESILFSDPYEAKEFVLARSHLIFLYALVIAVYIFLSIVKKNLDAFTARTKALSGSILLLLPVVLLGVNILLSEPEQKVFLPTRVFEHYSKYIGLNPVSSTLSGFILTISHQKQIRRLIEKRGAFAFNSQQDDSKKEELYIIVIGESSRRRNWGLFGYQRPTNPNLTRIVNLIPFKDAIAPGVTTSYSIPSSFSLATPDNYELFYTTKSLLSAFKELNFKTYWVSNQGQLTTMDKPTSLMMKEADEAISTNFGFWNASLDEKLLPELKKILNSPNLKKVVVLHTLGSHTNYKQRFPKGFDLQKSDVSIPEAHTWPDINPGEQRVIDNYDKSVAYTDWLLSEIINMHDRTGVYGAVIYFSDHGQRLYDSTEKQKGHGYLKPSRLDVDIPFFIWLSDEFIEFNPGVLKAIKNNAPKPISTADFIYSMLDLATIQTDYDETARSFFGEQYQPQPRRIRLLDGKSISYEDLAPIAPGIPGTESLIVENPVE